MGYEITYPVDQKPTDAQILRILREQYPTKQFAVGPGNTIVESYIDQPVNFELPHGSRVARATGTRAVAEAVDAVPSYLERTMSNDV